MKQQPVPLQAFIDDKSFRDLLRTTQRRAITWDEFLGHSLPSGVSALECWAALESLGRCLGVHLFVGFEDDLLWYRRTYELESLARSLEERAAKDGLLGRALASPSTDLSQGLWFREVHSTFARAGVSLRGDDLALARGLGIAPARPVERIALNALEMGEDLSCFQDRPLDSALLEELYQGLVSGLSAEEVEHAGMLMSASPVGEAEGMGQLQAVSRALAYADTGEPHGEDLPVLRALIVSETLRSARLYGPAYAALSSLVRRLIFAKSGLDALGALPFSETYASWKRGLFLFDSRYRFGECVRTMRHTRTERTLLCTVGLLCLSRLAEEAEAQAEQQMGMSSALEAGAFADERFNQRQRKVLARALQEPGCELSIADHGQAHGISYATARRDLVALCDAGYLSCEQQGKASVFVPAVGLASLRERYLG